MPQAFAPSSLENSAAVRVAAILSRSPASPLAFQIFPDQGMAMTDVRVLEKDGGKSGIGLA
jgi:hypothetical protein